MLKRLKMTRWDKFWHFFGHHIETTRLSVKHYTEWWRDDWDDTVDGYCPFCLTKFYGEPWADTAAGGCNSGSGIDWTEI